MFGAFVGFMSEVLSVALALAGQYGIATIHPMRHRRAYLVGSLVFSTLVYALADAWEWLDLAYVVLFFALLPMALLRGSVWRRLYAIAVGLVPMAVTELIIYLLVLVICDGGDPHEFVGQEPEFMLGYRLCALVAMMLYVRWARRRLGRALERERIDDGLSYFAAGAFLHLALPFAIYIVVSKAHLEIQEPLNLVAMLSVLLLMIVGALLMLHVERVRRVAVELARLRSAQKQLDAALVQYDHVAREAVRFARLRHDARNHLHTISLLASAGELDRARSYADEMVALLIVDEKDPSQGPPCSAVVPGASAPADEPETGDAR